MVGSDGHEDHGGAAGSGDTPNRPGARPVARRNVLIGAGATLGAGLGLGAARLAGAAAPGARRLDPRPNVLWIITDDATRRTLATMPHTDAGCSSARASTSSTATPRCRGAARPGPRC